jgi:hypothetical protein
MPAMKQEYGFTCGITGDVIRAAHSLVFLVLLALVNSFATPRVYAQNQPGFVAGVNYPSGVWTGTYIGGILPIDTQLGDFNGDKNQDLVAIVTCGSLPQCPNLTQVWTIAVYLGNGDGTFQAPIVYGGSLPADIRAIAVADFNGDGKLDVAVAADCLSNQDCSEATITILLGNGDGTFTQASQYVMNGVVSQAHTIATGDFNGDNIPDLVVGLGCDRNLSPPTSSCSTGSVNIFLGNGDGTFGSPATYSTVGNAALIPVVGDFNGDGHQDIVAGGSASLTVLLGNGDGRTFAPTCGGPFVACVTPLTFSGISALSAAPLNVGAGDTNLDLVVTAGSAGIQIMNGSGNGSFSAPIPVSTAISNPAQTQVAYMNGEPDLVIGGSVPNGTNGVQVILNDGAETFTSLPIVPLGGWANSSLWVADFNSDGNADVALISNCSEVSPYCPDGTISILLGNGDGTMQGAYLPVSGSQTSSGSAVAILVDVDGDTIPDLVTAQQQGSQGVVTVAKGLGQGKYGPPMSFPAGISSLRVVRAADLRGDGIVDLVVAGDGVAVLLGNPANGAVPVHGDGTFQSPSLYQTLTNAVDAQLGDFAGTGNLGVAVLYPDDPSSSTGSGAVGIFLGNGDGTLQQPEVVTDTTEITGYALTVGDFNHDTRADVAVVGAASPEGLAVNAVTVLLSKVNSDGTLTLSVQPNPATVPAFTLCVQEGTNTCVILASYPVAAEVGPSIGASITTKDLNADGNLDLVIANQCELNDCSTGLITFWLGNGDGTFGLGNSLYGPPRLGDANYYGLTVADVNGDGLPDIEATTGSGVAVFLNTSNLGLNPNIVNFGNGIVYAAEGFSQQTTPTVVALNGDGSPPDIAVYNGSSLAILFNRSGSTPTATSTSVASSLNPSIFSEALTLTATVTTTSGTPTGMVTFYDGGTSIGTSTVSGSSQATFSTSALATGMHSITANYSGDATHAKSTAPVLSLTINQASLALAVSSGTNPSTWGQSVNLTATLTPQFGGRSTGTVTFIDGTTVLGSVTPNNNLATLSVSTLAAGTHSIKASYSGDMNFLATTSSALSEVVNTATTTTVVTSSMNPQQVSQPIKFTATVISQFGGAATGSIVFKAGTTAIGTVAVSGNQASLTTSYSTAGTRSIAAQYSGDSNNTASISAAFSQSVVKIFATTTTLTSTLNPSFINQAITFTAAVSSTGGTPPDGEVITFAKGTTTLGTAPLTGGSASLTITTLPVGTDTVRASYPGDPSFKASISAVLSQVVDKYTTSTSLTSSLNPSTYGQSITFTASVTSTGPTAPTGNVVFADGTTTLGTVPLNTSGVAILTKSNLPAAALSVTATYKGDTESATSSGGLSQVVNQAVTTTTLTSSRNPSTSGQSVKLTAIVASPTTTPTGTVTFTLGTTVLGAGTLAGGKVTLTTTTLPTGTDQITATYAGTANITGSSGTLTQQVN